MSTFDQVLNRVSELSASVIIDASLKATVVLLLTAITAWAFRRASAALRHRVWFLGLCGAMLMPVLSLSVPELRLAVLPPRPVLVENVPPSTDSDVVSAASQRQPGDAASVLSPDHSPQNAGEDSFGSRFFDENKLNASRPATSPELAGAVAAAAAVERAETQPAQQPAAEVWDVRRTFVGAWLLGVLLVTTPLLCGFLANLLLRRNAHQLLSEHWSRVISELSARIGLTRSVVTLESPLQVIPMTWGVLRPTVLLPESWRDWPDERRRCVLLHELAHVKRLDVCFQLIGRLAVALHWMNPLAWYALRQLRIERELACDDCVIASGERASDYARELLQIARQYRPRRLAIGVAMARTAKLDDRIVSILDQAKSRLPVGRSLAVGLLAVSATLFVTVAATRLVERLPDASANSGRLNDAPVEATSVPALANADAGNTISGIVLKPDGTPAGGAHVFAHRVVSRHSLGNSEVHTLAETQAADDGSFTMKLTDDENYDSRGMNQDRRRQESLQIAATAEGYGIGFSRIPILPNNKPVRIELAEQRALTGRLVDLEGRALAGIELSILGIAEPSEPLNEWLRKAAHNPRPDGWAAMMATSSKAESQPRPIRFPSAQEAALDGTKLIPSLVTDQDGHFAIPGIGPDRLVDLRVTGTTVARSMVRMLTHPGPGVFDAYPDPRVRDGMIHGADATIALEPAATIEGVITSQSTGLPIEGCIVEIDSVAGSRWSIEGFASSVTDAAGRYVLDRLPPDVPGSRGYSIQVIPPARSPHFSTKLEVRIPGTERVVTRNVALPESRLITGRVIDARTGEPVRAMVGFLPTLENNAAADYPNFVADLRSFGYQDFRLNESDGSFAVPSINGGGALCITAERTAAYVVGGHAELFSIRQAEIDNIYDLNLYHLAGAFMCNEFRKVTLAPEDADPVIEVALQPHSRRVVKIVDVAGKPVTGCFASGLLPDTPMAGRNYFLNDSPLATAEAEVVGLEFESPRPVVIYHQARNLGTVLITNASDAAGTEPLTATLLPCGRIHGRLLDKSGQPIQGRLVRAQALLDFEPPKTKYQFRPARFMLFSDSVRTDAEGRFELTQHVIPGVRYSVQVVDEGPPRERPLQESIPRDPTAKETGIVQPGEIINIGDLTPEATNADAASPTTDKAITEGPLIQDNGTVGANAQAATVQIRGQIHDVNGRPVGGAVVTAVDAFPAVATWKEIQRDLHEGPDAAITRLLEGQSQSEQSPADFEHMAGIIGQSAVASGNPNRLKAWWLYRMVATPDPLAERMTLMWHNHFATSNLKVEDVATMQRQNEIFRKNCRAPFGELLRGTIKDPALLIWLDADANRREHPNENLAREIMELFTLGVGNYSEHDIREAARAMTGWTVQRGQFHFKQEFHDDGEKTIFGRTGLWSGDDLVRLLLEHPAVARRLAFRIGELLMGEGGLDNAALEQLATGLREHDLNVAWGIETVLRSEEFFSDSNIGNRVMSPVEYIIGTVRALEIVNPPPSTLLMSEWTANLGQDLLYPPNVFGWTGGRSWLTSRALIGRANFASAMISGLLHNPPRPFDASACAARNNCGAADEICSLFSALLLGDEVSAGPRAPTESPEQLVMSILASPRAQLA